MALEKVFKQDKIYIKASEVPATKTRKALVKLFLNGQYASYSDAECTKVQCEKGRYRSISELHQIVLSRFPITSLQAIIRIIYECMNEDKNIILVYCCTVNKVVLRYIDNKSAEWVSDYSSKHYADKEGVDGYSLNDYQKIIDEIKKNK